MYGHSMWVSIHSFIVRSEGICITHHIPFHTCMDEDLEKPSGYVYKQDSKYGTYHAYIAQRMAMSS